jgi:exodeoxyribonuclease-3
VAAEQYARPQVIWRLDVHLATPGVTALARKEAIHIESRFSDHAPLTIDYDFTL